MDTGETGLRISKVESSSRDGSQSKSNFSQTLAVKWPLDFKLKKDWPSGPQKQWHYWQYQDSQNRDVEVIYSRTKADSELLAQEFLDEPILGFDMEWPWHSEKSTRLQQKVGLIQIACETKIGLFHIGLHAGNTSEDLIAPSLRKIIETPNIAKVGVAILNADFSRLENWFHLKPKGAFELSHLHNLITFGPEHPELITTKLKALAQQVEFHLGLPLGKGPVRTSNWSKPLNQDQRTYAADDAYAGFMLYHRMNAKRMAMDPTPPLPLFAESYALVKAWPYNSIRFESPESGAIVTAHQFYAEHKRQFDGREGKNTQVQSLVENTDDSQGVYILADVRDKSKDLRTRANKRKSSNSLDAAAPKELYDRLVQRRKALATAQNLPAFCIAANTVLEDLARLKPETKMSMLKIKGIGKQKLSKYGAEWLEVITKYIVENEAGASGNLRAASIVEELSPPSSLMSSQSSKSSTCAKGLVMSATCKEYQHLTSCPQLHTGLSFSMAFTEIEDKGNGEAVVTHGSDSEDSEDSSAFGAPLPSPLSSTTKRKRHQDPSRETSPPATVISVRSDHASIQSRILTNKLIALTRKVASELNLKDTSLVASDNTIKHIVGMTDVTLKNLYQIPDIMRFVDACAKVELNLFNIITKFTNAIIPKC